MLAFLEPRAELQPREVERGLRWLLWDGVLTEAMAAVTGGAFLVAFALMLGASNTVIGLIAAASPLTKILQIPATLLVERLRRRKLLVVIGILVRRSCWLLIAALAFADPQPGRLPAFVGLLAAYFAVGAISSCALGSWVRDLVPEERLGRYFAKRMAAATGVSAALTLAGGFAVDRATAIVANPGAVYGVLFGLGAVLGLIGVVAVARIPEPRMDPPAEVGLLAALTEPLREENFRRLLAFVGSWHFAVSLAAPFFTVYMIVRLELPMAWILGLAVLSQIVNVLILRSWGQLADRFSHKSVLSVAGTLFIISIGLWPFTTLPEKHLLTLPLLVVIHLLAGMSTAGVNLSATGIGVKLAPRGRATAYLATNALFAGLAATIAPILAGLLADALAGEKLVIQLRWLGADEATRLQFYAVSLYGLDFIFVIAFLLGLYALHRLLAVREEGEVKERVIATELFTLVLRSVRHVSNVAGLRQLSSFPFSILRQGADKQPFETK